MQAFHNDPEIKAKYLARLQAHYEADEFEKGIYWENGRGCAVGCTVHSKDHGAYERELGIPNILAKLEDSIFETLPDCDAKEWPKKFLESITVGADLSGVWPKFVVWLLTDSKHGVLQYAKTEESKIQIKNVANLYKKYKNTTLKKWREARNSATDAYTAAHAAAYAASSTASYADAAAYAASATTATTAAADAAADAYAIACYCASYTAGCAPVYAMADTAGEAAAYAAYVDIPTTANGSYAASARKKHRIEQSKKLLELLSDCK